LWGAHRETLSILRAMIAAPPLPDDPPDGAWGSVEGRIRARLEMSGHLEKDRSDTGSSSWWVVKGTFTLSGPPQIETRGGTLELESSSDGLWATTERSVRYHAKDWRQDRIVERIPEGGGVLAVGKIRRTGGAPRLVASGKESLLLFGTAPEAGGRAAAARVLRGWRLSLLPMAAAALLALVVAASAVATVAWPAAAPVLPQQGVILPPPWTGPVERQ
jgi:hypothetical protein